jgi:hypothetical protein
MTLRADDWTIGDRIGDAARLYFGAAKRLNARLRRIGQRTPTVGETAGLHRLRGLAEIHRENVRFWKDVKARGWTVAWAAQKVRDRR